MQEQKERRHKELKASESLERQREALELRKAELELEKQKIREMVAAEEIRTDDYGGAGEDNQAEFEKVQVRMPRTPSMKNRVEGISSDTLHKFGVGVKTYVGVKSSRLKVLYRKVFAGVSEGVERAMETLPTKDKRLDMAVFAAMSERATENIMQYVGDIEKCKMVDDDGGYYSGLMACKLIKAVVDQRTVQKRLELSKAVTRQKAVIDARELGDRLISFEELLGECRRNNVQVEAETRYLGLTNMI